MKNGIVLGIAALILLLSGCASTTYEMKGLSVDNAAYLKADSERAHGIFAGLDERLYIHEINGEAAGDFIKGYPESAKIIAGLNEVKVEYWHSMITSNGCVKFNAEAGNTYIIRKKRDGMSVYYWVVLEGSETPISKACSA